jgi:hypothetical protein
MSMVLMESNQLAGAAPHRFKDEWQEMDTLKQLAYKTLNMLKLVLIDNFTEKLLHFNPKLSRRLMKNSTNLQLPRSVNNHRGNMAKHSPSKICEQPPREYGKAFSKLLILNVTTTAHLPTLSILSPVTSFNSPTITMCHIPRCIKNHKISCRRRIQDLF